METKSIEMKRTAEGCGYWQGNGAFQAEYDEMWKRLVPIIGEAQTTNGELLRTVGKLYYDYFNNGNMNAQERKYYDDDDDYDTEVSEHYQKCLNYIDNTCSNDYELHGLLKRVKEIILECDGSRSNPEDEHTYNLMVDHVIFWALTHEDKDMNPFAKLK